MEAAALRIELDGPDGLAALLEAAGEAAFFRSMALGQLAILRQHRAAGMAWQRAGADLRRYRKAWRTWRRLEAERRAAWLATAEPAPLLAVAAE